MMPTSDALALLEEWQPDACGMYVDDFFWLKCCVETVWREELNTLAVSDLEKQLFDLIVVGACLTDLHGISLVGPWALVVMYTLPIVNVQGGGVNLWTPAPVERIHSSATTGALHYIFQCMSHLINERLSARGHHLAVTGFDV